MRATYVPLAAGLPDSHAHCRAIAIPDVRSDPPADAAAVGTADGTPDDARAQRRAHTAPHIADTVGIAQRRAHTAPDGGVTTCLMANMFSMTARHGGAETRLGTWCQGPSGRWAGSRSAAITT